MRRLPHYVVIMMGTEIVTGVDFEVPQAARQNVIAGLADAAPIGEEIVSRRSRGTRMTHHLQIAKMEATKIAGPMPEK